MTRKALSEEERGALLLFKCAMTDGEIHRSEGRTQLDACRQVLRRGDPEVLGWWFKHYDIPTEVDDAP